MLLVEARARPINCFKYAFNLGLGSKEAPAPLLLSLAKRSNEVVVDRLPMALYVVVKVCSRQCKYLCGGAW